jgi:succinate dehydrogenase / fumarate reductase flavoprotein subunit
MDKGTWVNQTVHYTRQLYSMLHLAKAMALGALQRNESRGAHYKPEFPKRDDDKFLKTTVARLPDTGVAADISSHFSNLPEMTYESVDVSLIVPRERHYETEKKAH